MSKTEPFPLLPDTHHHVYPVAGAGSSDEPQPRRRRQSSNNLPGELHGDTDVPAFATRTDSFANVAAAAEAEKRYAAEKALRPHSKRRKAKSVFRRWKSISLRHTWLNPLIIMLVILGLYARNPTPSNVLHHAVCLSYPLPQTSPTEPIQYGKGGHDFTFVAFYTVVFSFTREFLMQRMIRQIATYYGIRSRAKQSRFMEQFYTAVYFAFLGPFGLYVMSRTPIWYFNTTAMFEGFPHRQHEGLFKAYYLLQAAYWTQQFGVLLLQLEAPRKDFKELVAHHVITIALIWCSYRFHFTYMGLAVYITHDISDFFLATSKIFNYLSLAITPYYFGLFACIWIYLRHYQNLRVLYAVLTEFRTVGPYELNWETQQYKCWISQIITFLLLAALQSVNLFWLYLILKIAKRSVFDNTLEDSRSEDYGDETDGDNTEEKRRALGLKQSAPGQSLSQQQSNGHSTGNGSTIAPPKVLVNGVPIDTVRGATGARSVEISAAQQRKSKAKTR